MSTQGKATPGPWRVANVGAVVCDTHDETTHHKPFELEDYGGALIAESIKHPPNARLIAAAPSMHATLEKLRVWLIAPDLHASTLDEMRKAIEETLALIATT